MPDAGSPALTELVRNMRAREHRMSGMSILGVYLSRPIGRYLAAIAYRGGLSPNALTALSVALSVVAAITLQFAETSLPLALTALVLLVIAEFLDYADGDLARVSGRSSRLGEWFDHTVDPAKRVIVAGALAAALSDGDRARWAPIVVTYFLAVVLTTYTAGTLFPKLAKVVSPDETPPRAVEPAAPPMPLGKRLLSTSFLALADPLLVAFGALLVLDDDVLFAYLVFLAVSNTAVMLALTAKWSRALHAIDERTQSQIPLGSNE